MAETETLTLGYSTVNPLVVWLSDLVPELPYRGNRTAPPPHTNSVCSMDQSLAQLEVR